MVKPAASDESVRDVGARKLALHGVPEALAVFNLIQSARAEALRAEQNEEEHGEAAGER
jgi:hypothetical protein